MPERVENLNVQCFMCRNIALKIREKKTLTSGEEYHLDTDLAAISKLRQFIPEALHEEEAE